MKEKDRKDIYFVLYIIAVLVMSVIYFTVPGRKQFIENQLDWWGELWEVVKGFISYYRG